MVGTAAAATAALAQPSGGIVQPDWARKPDAKSVSDHYPALAYRFDVPGLVKLSCKVNVRGSLSDCEVASEEPDDFGFGAAALSMADQFLMRPMSQGGWPLEGGRVRIPLRFHPSPRDQPPRPAPVRLESLPEARALAATFQGPKAADVAFDRGAQALEGLSAKDVSIETRRAAVAAFRQAADAHRAEIEDAHATAFAATYAPAELADMVRFASSPVGRALRERTEFLYTLDLIREEYARSVRSRAHTAFCAHGVCGQESDVARVWRSLPSDADRLDSPQWDRTPGRGEINAALPGLIRALGVTGVARLTCVAAQEGKLDGCRVDEESPAGFGVGAASLRLTSSYRLSSIQLLSGGLGKRVTVRIGFTPPPLAEIYTHPSAPDAQAVLARKLPDVRSSLNPRRKVIDDKIAEWIRETEGADTKIKAEVEAAFRLAGEEAYSDAETQMINAWASNLSAQELTALLTYRQSPAGKAELERDEEFKSAFAANWTRLDAVIQADAREIFCRGGRCGSPSLQTRVEPANATPAP